MSHDTVSRRNWLEQLKKKMKHFQRNTWIWRTCEWNDASLRIVFKIPGTWNHQDCPQILEIYLDTLSRLTTCISDNLNFVYRDLTFRGKPLSIIIKMNTWNACNLLEKQMYINKVSPNVEFIYSIILFKVIVSKSLIENIPLCSNVISTT